MIHTGLPCLECGREIVRGKTNNTTDRLMFCGNVCSGRWCNRGRDRRSLGPNSSRVVALLQEAGTVTPVGVARSLGITRHQAKECLRRLWNTRRVKRVNHGVYALLEGPR